MLTLQHRRVRLVLLGTLAVLVVALVGLAINKRAQFVAGGALVNLGYRFQDHLVAFDFDHHEDIKPEEVWAEIVRQNRLASSVRKTFPRTARHPLAAMVVCMDARIDTSELTGDTRKYYYIIRTAGSVLAQKEQEMLELAVTNGVKVLVLTTHTDCAAEKAWKNPEAREKYPALVAELDERERRVAELLARPVIAERIANGTLMVKRMNIDTETDEIVSLNAAHAGELPLDGADHANESEVLPPTER